MRFGVVRVCVGECGVMLVVAVEFVLEESVAFKSSATVGDASIRAVLSSVVITERVFCDKG